MGHIFVSYSRRQLYFAESVVLQLQKARLEVWFDLQKLTPGVDWAVALRDGYSNCDKLILIASQFAIRSPYVQVEWETALQNGREVIVVLTEAVTLPESLRGCAVYDARIHFDRTIQSLITYLLGEAPARHDPVPAPGKSPYSLTMPFDIWLTLGALLMPSLTVWIATFSIPSTSVKFGIDLNAPAQKLVFYLVGLYLGFNLVQAQFPVRAFWQHDVRYEELKETRGKMLWIQFVISLFALVFTALGPDHSAANPIAYLIWLCPLISAYWAFWVLPRSPDILRWLPSGEADQEMREAVQGKLSTPAIAKQSGDRDALPVKAGNKFAMHYHPADAYVADSVQSILRSANCQFVPEAQADTHLVIVSNRTSKSWLLDLPRTVTGRVIHILATNINTPPELQPVLQTQWVDFRAGRARTIRALADALTDKDGAGVRYGLQISPTGFDTLQGFPRGVVLVLGSLFLLLFAFFAILGLLQVGDERMMLGLIIVLTTAVLFYIDALVMRRASLPRLVHRMLGHRVAWFATRAPAAADPIGNTDRKYAYQLTNWVPRS